MKVGPLLNSYLIHEIVLARCHHALSLLLELDKSATAATKLDIERPNPIEKNTALNLAVALCDKPIVQVSGGVVCVSTCHLVVVH